MEIEDGRGFPLCLMVEQLLWSGHAGSCIGCSMASILALLVLSPGGKVYLPSF